MCGALCLRQHETARSYLSDSPTRKSSTHSTIITRNRSYVNHRLRPKIFILSSFCNTFAYTTVNGVRGNGRDQFSLTERPSVIEELLKKTLNGVWGKILNNYKILSATIFAFSNLFNDIHKERLICFPKVDKLGIS